jgi:peroxiredoxin Q/BCP
MATKNKKKSTKKTAKKAAKKAVKKKAPAKKTKASKKPAKKAVKKTSKKAAPAKKKAPAKKAAASKPAAPKTAKPAKAPAGPHPLLGAHAPAATLSNQRGEAVNLADLTRDNAKVVLYFYPKDDTPGCTTEACNFRDSFNRIQGSGTVVVGVSPDDVASHQKFIAKHGLNFDLLVDEGHKLAEQLGVWKEKQFMGRKYMGVERSTFLFHNGKVAKAWQPVSVEGHVDEVLKSVEALG